MLGRVANGIFWMYRYLERAENTARLLAAGHRMAMTRGADAAVEEWRSVLTTLGLLQSYEAHHHDFSSAPVCDFVLRGKDNPDSVLAMIEAARFNARMCRSALTLEVWEAINEGRCARLGRWQPGTRPTKLGGRSASCCCGRCGSPDCGRCWQPSAGNRRWFAGRRPIRCCATSHTVLRAPARSSSAPTTPRAFSTSN